MVKWIVVAVCLVALIVLVLAVRPVVARLPRLHRAVRRLRLHEEQALRLQGRAEVLEQTLLGLQRSGESAQQQLAVIRAARGGGGPHAG